MKRILLILVFLFSINSFCFAGGALTEQIAQIEKNYFGYDYPNESDIKRIERLEKAVYGTTYQGSQVQRTQKLFNDLQANIALADESPQETLGEYQEELPAAEKDVRYPVVDKIESKVFKKTFQNEDIYLRLSRLEKQVFKKESKSSLSERVDNLRSSVLGAVSANDDVITLDGYDPYEPMGVSGDLPEDEGQYNYYSPQNTKNRVAKPDFGYKKSYGDEMESYDIDMLESSVLNRKFAGEPASRRLARLENSVFQKTFSDSEDARIQRLLAATTAQKTSKHYDNNRLMQNLNTGIQIGGIILMVLAMIL